MAALLVLHRLLPQPLALRPFRATDATDPMLGMLANTDAPAALALVEAGWLEAHYGATSGTVLERLEALERAACVQGLL